MTLAGLPRAGAFSKPHDYKQNVQKMKGLLKKWALTGNSLKISNQKNQKYQSPHGEQKNEPQDPKAKTEHDSSSREEINWSKIEKKTFRIELFKLCKTRTKKSRPHLFNFM